MSDLDSVEEAKAELERQLTSVESDEFIVDSPIRETISLEPVTDRDENSSDIQEILAIVKNQNVSFSKMEELLEYSIKSRSRDREMEEIARIRHLMSSREHESENMNQRIMELDQRNIEIMRELMMARQKIAELQTEVA